MYGLPLTGQIPVFLKRDNDSQRFVFKTAKAASMLR